MKYLVDTCVISEFVKPRPATEVTTWLAQHDESHLFLSVLTLGEIRKGIEKLPNTKRRAMLKGWLNDDLRSRFESRILGVTLDVAITWGAIQGNANVAAIPYPVIDALIAATALTHDLTVVTRNKADMARSGVRIFNPWGE